MPWVALGASKPAVVRNDTSTIASSPNGLKSASQSCAPRTVVPSAKNQSGDGSRAHGPTATSLGVWSFFFNYSGTT
jgi:hypothetical protein